MNTHPSQFKLPAFALSFIAALGLLGSPSGFAGHDHDHIYVRMVEYVGFNRESEHFIIKVKRFVDQEPVYYYLHFLEDISSLRNHEGEQMQISLADDGKWARLSFRRHGTWRIYSREQAN
jgi:hypothetical protein